MKKNVLIGSVVALLAVAAIPIVAYGGRGHGQGHGFCKGGGAMGKLHNIKDELDLTKAQEEQIHSIMRDVRASNEPQLAAIHDNLKNAAKVIVANPTAIAEAQQVLAAQSAAKQQLKSNILDGVARAAEVLTPEQRQKLVLALD